MTSKFISDCIIIIFFFISFVCEINKKKRIWTKKKTKKPKQIWFSRLVCARLKSLVLYLLRFFLVSSRLLDRVGSFFVCAFVYCYWDQQCARILVAIWVIEKLLTGSTINFVTNRNAWKQRSFPRRKEIIIQRDKSMVICEHIMHNKQNNKSTFTGIRITKTEHRKRKHTGNQINVISRMGHRNDRTWCNHTDYGFTRIFFFNHYISLSYQEGIQRNWNGGSCSVIPTRHWQTERARWS